MTNKTSHHPSCALPQAHKSAQPSARASAQTSDISGAPSRGNTQPSAHASVHASDTSDAPSNVSAQPNAQPCAQASATSHMSTQERTKEHLLDMSSDNFSRALASKTSIPGGGGAAAYVGALGCALCAMCGNFTVGKKKYADVEARVVHLNRECERTRARLCELVDTDAQAFYPLSRAYSIPKDDATRADQIEACTRAALAPPLEMMREIAHAIELLEEMYEIGSRMLLSDVGCGAALAMGALHASSLNVFVNTKALMNREFAEKIEREADELLEYATRAQNVYDKVSAHIRGTSTSSPETN